MADYKLTEADAGCWLDGSQGWHNTYRVIDRAYDNGWDGPSDGTPRRDIDAATGLYSVGPTDESVTLSTGETLTYDVAYEWIADQGGLSDEATEYLQSIAPDGYVFEWDMGELSLIRESETETYGL